MHRRMVSKKHVKSNEDVKVATSSTLMWDSTVLCLSCFLLVILDTSVKPGGGEATEMEASPC